MDRFDKVHFCILYNGCHYGIIMNNKKQISCRVYKVLYDFILSHYHGTFAEFLDDAMRNYAQVNAEAFVNFRYKK